jgi:hypothetical protein
MVILAIKMYHGKRLDGSMNAYTDTDVNIEKQIEDLQRRIEKLESRPVLYQRRGTLGNATGLVYAQGQNVLHEPVELEHIKNKGLENG